MPLIRTLLLALACSTVHAAADPIRPHPDNPRYFLFRGKPTLLITSAEHYGAILNEDFDWKKYLDTLARDGMNYTRIFTGSYVEVPGNFGITRNTLAPKAGRFLAPWMRSDQPGYRMGGNRFDLSRFNPAYFEKLKAFAAAAAERAIVVEVTLFCSTYSGVQWEAHPFHPANNINKTRLRDWKKLNTPENAGLLAVQEALTRRIVGELAPFDNVFYELQNEPWADAPVVVEAVNPYIRGAAQRQWPNSVDRAGARSLEFQRLAAGWIRDEESKLGVRHMVAQNWSNFKDSVPALDDGVDMVNFHYAFPEAVVWNLALRMPIGYDETGFIGFVDADYRAQAWRFMLAGGALFNNLDYSFSPGLEDGSDFQPDSPGGGGPALRRQLKLLADFMGRLPFLEMGPDQTLVAHSPGALSQALSRPGQVYALHLKGQGPVPLKLQLPAGSYLISWFFPENGEPAGVQRLDHKGGVLSLTTPDFAEDLAARIDKE
jgi:hypothetical protein